ncbi:hypothetical protein JL722_12063 [Aureococcus anophagefferens]|nr:hypothetical protein JL722_12063 [Aureococcus anophagefferens]
MAPGSVARPLSRLEALPWFAAWAARAAPDIAHARDVGDAARYLRDAQRAQATAAVVRRASTTSTAASPPALRRRVVAHYRANGCGLACALCAPARLERLGQVYARLDAAGGRGRSRTTRAAARAAPRPRRRTRARASARCWASTRPATAARGPQALAAARRSARAALRLPGCDEACDLLRHFDACRAETCRVCAPARRRDEANDSARAAAARPPRRAPPPASSASSMARSAASPPPRVGGRSPRRPLRRRRRRRPRRRPRRCSRRGRAPRRLRSGGRGSGGRGGSGSGGSGGSGSGSGGRGSSSVGRGASGSSGAGLRPGGASRSVERGVRAAPAGPPAAPRRAASIQRGDSKLRAMEARRHEYEERDRSPGARAVVAEPPGAAEPALDCTPASARWASELVSSFAAGKRDAPPYFRNLLAEVCSPTNQAQADEVNEAIDAIFGGAPPAAAARRRPEPAPQPPALRRRGRGDAGPSKTREKRADVNARLFQLINYLDGSNGQPSGHGVRLSEFRGRWIDQRPDWNVARWGRGRPGGHDLRVAHGPARGREARLRGDGRGAPRARREPRSRGEGLRTPAQGRSSRARATSRVRAMLAAAAGGAACEAGEAGAADAAAEDVDALRAENARLRVEAAVLRAELDSRAGGAIQ